MKKNITIVIVSVLILLAAAVVFTLRFRGGDEDNWLCVGNSWVKHGNPSAPKPASGCGVNPGTATTTPTPLENQDIVVTSPVAGAIISSPLRITGKARGNWYFEAVFPVSLSDDNGKNLGTGQAHALGEWTTTDFVPFEAEINFTAPATAAGTLILKNDNPSGLPEKAKEFKVPLRFH